MKTASADKDRVRVMVRLADYRHKKDQRNFGARRRTNAGNDWINKALA